MIKLELLIEVLSQSIATLIISNMRMDYEIF